MDNNDEAENVLVVVRVRPLNQTEIKQGHKTVVHVDDSGKTITLRNTNAKSDEPKKSFTFDTVFGVNSKQVCLNKWQHFLLDLGVTEMTMTA